MWTIRGDTVTREVESTAAWTLVTARGAEYRVPRPLPGETAQAWVGRASALASLGERLANLHPLLPKTAGTAWARRGDGAPWLPVHGVCPPTGTPLAGVGDLTVELFWSTVPPLIEVLRIAQRSGLYLNQLNPAAIRIPLSLHTHAWTDQRQDHTKVAARFIHWFLCALRQAPAAGDPPSTLWAICARGLEGGYTRSGLFRLEADLEQAARPPLAHDAGRPAALIIDVDGIKEATGAYLHPWLTLEALTAPGQTIDPVLAVHGPAPIPTKLAAAWREARVTPQQIEHFGPKSVTDLVRAGVPAGRSVTLIAGQRNLEYTVAALRRAGYPCTAIGFRCEAGGPVANGMDRLRAALWLAAGGAPPEADDLEGGLDHLVESV